MHENDAHVILVFGVFIGDCQAHSSHTSPPPSTDDFLVDSLAVAADVSVAVPAPSSTKGLLFLHFFFFFILFFFFCFFFLYFFFLLLFLMLLWVLLPCCNSPLLDWFPCPALNPHSGRSHLWSCLRASPPPPPPPPALPLSSVLKHETCLEDS